MLSGTHLLPLRRSTYGNSCSAQPCAGTSRFKLNRVSLPADSSECRVSCVNQTGSSLIINCSNTGWASLPVEISTGRDFQTPIHQPNGKLSATTLNRLILQVDPLAKNVAASRKKSRFFLTRASSRLSRATSSSRAWPEPVNACGP